MARKENASFEKSGQRRSLSIDEALKRISELEGQITSISNEINTIKSDLEDKIGSNAPTIANPTLQFLLKDETVKAEIRRSGSSGQYGLSIVYTDEDGTNHFYNLVNHLGERQFPPLDHASTEWTYGPGTSTEYGHCRIIDNLNTSTNSTGYALSAHQGYVLEQKFGTVQIMSIGYLNADSSTFVDDGELWTDVAATIPETYGATNYYFVPISSNYGAVTQIVMNGRSVTCTVRNISGASHSCRVRGLAVACKAV